MMTHHKRKRPKSSRAGCLLCKPHKHQRRKNGATRQTMQERKARESAKGFAARGEG